MSEFNNNTMRLLISRIERNGDQLAMVAAHGDGKLIFACIEHPSGAVSINIAEPINDGADLVFDTLAVDDEADGVLSAHMISEFMDLAGDALEESCPRCGGSTDDGEGYDGYCGSCADTLEHKGAWS